MIKLKDLLKEKKLRVFDFDDTLVKTKAKVYITTGSGKKRVFTPVNGQFINQTPMISLIFLNLMVSYLNQNKLNQL